MTLILDYAIFCFIGPKTISFQKEKVKIAKNETAEAF
jgi:hypothetical protein